MILSGEAEGDAESLREAILAEIHGARRNVGDLSRAISRIKGELKANQPRRPAAPRNANRPNFARRRDKAGRNNDRPGRTCTPLCF